MELPALGHLPGWVGGKKIQMLPAAFRSGQTLARACCAIRVGQGWTWVHSAQHTVGTHRGSPPPASARVPCAASPTRPPCPDLGGLWGRWYSRSRARSRWTVLLRLLIAEGGADLGFPGFFGFLDGGLHLGTSRVPVRVRLVQSASCL